MASNLNADQQRAMILANGLANTDINTRRADIIELVTILKRLDVFQQMDLVTAVNNPQALRYLGSAGLQQQARANMINKLQSLAAIGIK